MGSGVSPSLEPPSRQNGRKGYMIGYRSIRINYIEALNLSFRFDGPKMFKIGRISPFGLVHTHEKISSLSSY